MHVGTLRDDRLHSSLKQLRSNVVAVLAMISPKEATEKLNAGYFITAERRIPDNYETFLRELGLRQGDGSRALRHTWYLPRGVQSNVLLFDTTSLHHAYMDLVEMCKV